MKKTTVLCAVLSVLFLASCNTIDGAGKDIEGAGQVIQNTF